MIVADVQPRPRSVVRLIQGDGGHVANRRRRSSKLLAAYECDRGPVGRQSVATCRSAGDSSEKDARPHARTSPLREGRQAMRTPPCGAPRATTLGAG